MADQLSQLNDRVTQLTQAANDTAARVADTQGKLQAAIDDLKNHPAAPDLTDIIGRIDAATASLGQIDPAPAAPAAPAAQ